MFENGELVTSNPAADRFWDAYLANHDVRFSIQPYYDQKVEPLSGQVTGELSVRMRYDNVVIQTRAGADRELWRGLRSTQTHIRRSRRPHQAKALRGVQLGLRPRHHVTRFRPQLAEEEAYVDDCEIYYYTRELDFTDASFSLKEITFTPTDAR